MGVIRTRLFLLCVFFLRFLVINLFHRGPHGPTSRSNRTLALILVGVSKAISKEPIAACDFSVGQNLLCPL